MPIYINECKKCKRIVKVPVSSEEGIGRCLRCGGGFVLRAVQLIPVRRKISDADDANSFSPREKHIIEV